MNEKINDAVYENRFTEEEIETLLAQFRPEPGERFYRRMENAPWRNENMEVNRRLSLRTAAVILGALLFLSGLVFFTPQGRALAQQVLQFFNRAGSDTLPADLERVNPRPEPERDRNIAEIETQSGMHVFVPAYLPEEMRFYGASYDEGEKIVIQQYGYAPDDIRLSLKQEPFESRDACTLCGLVGASAPVTEVSIRGSAGEYVEGVWSLTDDGPVWQNDPYLKTLRWQRAGTAYELIFMGLECERQDLIAIAESLGE